MTLALRVQGVAAAIGDRVPSADRPLAPVPAGSGLKPVPGSYGPPLLGQSLGMAADMLGVMRRRYARYGPVSWLGAYGTKAVLVLGPEAIGEVLTNRDKTFANGPGWEYFLGPFFTRGVMLMDFEEHHHHRRIMQQAFKRERLAGYLAAMNPGIDRALDRWPDGERFKLYHAAKRLTLDLASEVFVGAKLDDEADRLNAAFVDTVVAGMSLIRADVPGGGWRRGLRGRRMLEEFFRAELPATRAGDADDLFSVLCRAEDEEGARFSDDDIVNHMIFLLMAAHDTSTLTLTMMAYLLAKGRVGLEFQERLRAESRALGKPAIDLGDLDDLPALDLVFKETLRMFAPVGILARRAIRDTAIAGHYVPAGTLVALGLYPSQRLEPWWSEPDVFDPERFSAERREDRSHQYAWAPFGGNVHKCIGMHFGGMEVKAIMHQLLLRFSWSVPDDYEPPLAYATGPLPADGLPIKLRRLEAA